jgi:hypothetical protein
MSNNFDLQGGQDKEAMTTASIEPTPTMHLRSRTQILEEEERRQRITRVATNILQVTLPHNMNKQDDKMAPVPPPMAPYTTIMTMQSIPGRDSGFQQVMSQLDPRLTNDTFSKRKLDWQWNAVADRSKQGPLKEKAKMLQSFAAFLIMHPQLRYVMCVHSAHVYHPLAGSPSELNGKMVAFIGDRTATRMLIPVKLPPRSSFEFLQLKVVFDPRLMEEAYKESGVTGTLWQPLGTITK